MNIQEVKLVKNSEGRWVMNKDAASILRKAKSITVSHRASIPSETYLLLELEKKAFGNTWELYYKLPINVLEQQFDFRVSIYNHSQHALQALVKSDSVIVFMPLQDGLKDIVRYFIHRNGKVVSGIFEQKNAKKEDDPLRMVISNKK